MVTTSLVVQINRKERLTRIYALMRLSLLCIGNKLKLLLLFELKPNLRMNSCSPSDKRAMFCEKYFNIVHVRVIESWTQLFWSGNY